MTGGGVGSSTGDVIPDGGLSGSGHNMGINHSIIFDVSRGGATTGVVGGGTGPSGRSAVGSTSVVTTCAGSCEVAVTCSQFRVAKLSCVAAVSPTDSPVMTETVVSSEMSLVMFTIVVGPRALTGSG